MFEYRFFFFFYQFFEDCVVCVFDKISIIFLRYLFFFVKNNRIEIKKDGTNDVISIFLIFLSFSTNSKYDSDKFMGEVSTGYTLSV